MVVRDACWSRVSIGEWTSSASNDERPADLRQLDALSELVLGRHVDTEGVKRLGWFGKPWRIRRREDMVEGGTNDSR